MVLNLSSATCLRVYCSEVAISLPSSFQWSMALNQGIQALAGPHAPRRMRLDVCKVCADTSILLQSGVASSQVMYKHMPSPYGFWVRLGLPYSRFPFSYHRGAGISLPSSFQWSTTLNHGIRTLTGRHAPRRTSLDVCGFVEGFQIQKSSIIWSYVISGKVHENNLAIWFLGLIGSPLLWVVILLS